MMRESGPIAADPQPLDPERTAECMVDETRRRSLDEERAEAASLRQALGAMRREAEQEVARINGELRARAATEPTTASATEGLALRQELETLQRTLVSKERALDAITGECRRLEDALEDQNLVFDGMRKEVERRDLSLRVAQEEVDRLRQALLDLQTGFDPSLHRGGHPEAPVVRARPRAVNLALVLILGGLTLLILGGVVWMRLERPMPFAPTIPGLDVTGDSFVGDDPSSVSGTDPQPSPAAISAPTPAATAPSAQGAAGTPDPVVRRDTLRQGRSGPALASLPGGRFEMGRNSTTATDYGPAREVEIAPFLIGVHEVTFKEYDDFARATGRALPSDFGWGRGQRPVVGVTWDDAQAYAAWLSRQTGQAYRLPSEAEWEYAARAGGRGSYWWGFGLEPNRAVCFDCGSAWDNRSTAPVGSFAPSPFGLYDTAGNAMEWVADCYNPGYRGAPGDGRPRLDGPCAQRVARGGAYNKPSASMRAHARAHFPPETRLGFLGFRIARDP
jgi:formylglycine-generating enzyme required for sulfatase activity